MRDSRRLRGQRVDRPGRARTGQIRRTIPIVPGRGEVLASSFVQHPFMLAGITPSEGTRTMPGLARIPLMALACGLFASAAHAQCPENFGLVGGPVCGTP